MDELAVGDTVEVVSYSVVVDDVSVVGNTGKIIAIDNDFVEVRFPKAVDGMKDWLFFRREIEKR